MKEVNNNTAGVNYFSDDITLVVTVVNGENGNLRIAGVHTKGIGEGTTKSDTFENTYSAGTLSVSKTVTGNGGDKDKYFEFHVTLTGETGKTYGESYSVSGGSYTNNPASIKIGEETTFYLKDAETISIANLPYGVSYEVTENSYTSDGYTTTRDGDDATISAATQTVKFTNNKTIAVDTGVVLDSLPYILVLTIAVAGVAVLFVKKRHEA